MASRFDHIDLRVRSLPEAQPFYAALLPALGFTRPAKIPGWFQMETADGSQFFGITESAGHVPNENRIAFSANSVAEVKRLAESVRGAGAKNVEGPAYENPGYYAVFFEDPSGNRLEICWRSSGSLGVRPIGA